MLHQVMLQDLFYSKNFHFYVRKLKPYLPNKQVYHYQIKIHHKLHISYQIH